MYLKFFNGYKSNQMCKTIFFIKTYLCVKHSSLSHVKNSLSRKSLLGTTKSCYIFVLQQCIIHLQCDKKCLWGDLWKKIVFSRRIQKTKQKTTIVNISQSDKTDSNNCMWFVQWMVYLKSATTEQQKRHSGLMSDMLEQTQTKKYKIKEKLSPIQVFLFVCDRQRHTRYDDIVSPTPEWKCSLLPQM